MMDEAICINCGDPFDKRRKVLGYSECLSCASKAPPQKFTVAPAYNKGAYQLITKQNIKDIGR